MGIDAVGEGGSRDWPHDDYPEQLAEEFLEKSHGKFLDVVEKFGEGSGWREEVPEDMGDVAIR